MPGIARHVDTIALIIDMLNKGNAVRDISREFGITEQFEQVNYDLQIFEVCIPSGYDFIRVVEENYSDGTGFTRIYRVKNDSDYFTNRWDNLIFERRDTP